MRRSSATLPSAWPDRRLSGQSLRITAASERASGACGSREREGASEAGGGGAPRALNIVRAGDGVADQRIGPASRLRVVDAILSGTHEPDGSHYQVLRAFMDDRTLADANAALETMRYRTHEFGDSVLIERKVAAATSLSCDSCRPLWLQLCPA